MPEDKNAPIWKNLMKEQMYYNQTPRTKFVDEIKAVKVTLVSSPIKEDLYKLFKNVARISFNKSWQEMTYAESVEFLKFVLSGGLLPLALEMNNFTFLCEGLTRISTHAVVRGRIGVTYAQQSTGNSDQRHADILIPRSMSTQNKSLLESYLSWGADSKIKYAAAVDKGMSVQEARVFLPSTNSNKMYVSFNLASLMNFYRKRADTTEEYLQLNEVCAQIKKIFDIKYPELSPILKRACGQSCVHMKNSPLVNGVYPPTPADDVFPWNKESFVYDKTRDQMCWNDTPVITRYFIGRTLVDKMTFDKEAAKHAPV